MAIAPLQIPGYAAPQSLDFSPLANLGQQYKQAQQDAVRRDTLAQLGQGTGQIDPRALLASGDMSLANLGLTIQGQQASSAKDARDFAFRQEEAKRAQTNADRSYGLQARTAARADDRTPAGFAKGPDGVYAPLPGGPQDPSYMESVAAAKARAAALVPPAGFIRQPDGSVVPVPGGPQDPAYIGASESAKAKAKAAAGGDNPEYGLNPVYGVGPDGKPAVVQLSKNGKAYQPQLPEGFQISKDPIRVDAGTHINLLDPQTRQIVGTLPKNIAEVERQKVVGDAQGQAQIALPQVISNGNQILKTLTDIENHPGKNSSLGLYSALPVIPGTERANFRASMEQLQGQNFLQAYQTLRGGGAITDIEGKKGENAQARMQTAQTQESFDAALKDFKDVVKGGMLRAAAKARGAGAPTDQGSPQAAQSNTTKSGIQWSIQ